MVLTGGGILASLVAAEIVLRTVWGFGKMPLYAASNEWEYMAVPSQSGIRFGNHYSYNSYGMRSDEPDSTKAIVLGLGDSVIYGGVQTDQDSLATSIFSCLPGKQMLNISAGSWGPDNCAAYLRHYGTFGARAIFLYVSSHDAHDNMDFMPTVGHHPSYPDHQYPCAIIEVAMRYAWPRVVGLFHKQELDPDQKVVAGTDIDKKGIVFNPGFEQLRQIAERDSMMFIVCLHPDKKELEAGRYNRQGQEIIAWANAHNVHIAKELDYHFLPSDYRDGIHINESGQRKLAAIMKETLSGI